MTANKNGGPMGVVYIVGAGPGDPDLVTVKAARLVQECDVVLYDYLAPPELMELLRPDAERIYVGKQGGAHTLPQDKINSLLVEHARKGRKVVRLKGGDPFIFGRGGEEAEVLAEAGVPFELVPGVTSAIGAPAYAGIPLTHRRFSSSVIILTGHEDPTKPFSTICWDKVASGDSTLVILMGMKNLGENMKHLIDGGIDPETPVAIVRWGTRPSQQTLTGTVKTIAEEVKRTGFRAPAVIVVGKVVEFHEKFRWFENRPLLGKRIVVTRAREQASRLSQLLRDKGAQVLEAPTIEIAPQTDHKDVKDAIGRLENFDWVVLTSVNGVSCFFEALGSNGLDVRALGGRKIAAIGPATAQALKDRGIIADVVPDEFKAEGLIESFKVKKVEGLKILLARAEEAREVLPDQLKKMGAEVVIAPLYKSQMPPGGSEKLKGFFRSNKPDMITFASSSTVKNFMKMASGIDLAGVAIACIGPVTSDTARDLGLDVAVQPSEYTIPALVDSIVEYYK